MVQNQISGEHLQIMTLEIICKKDALFGENAGKERKVIDYKVSEVNRGEIQITFNFELARSIFISINHL